MALKRFFPVACIFLFVVLGSFIVRKSVSVPALTWMLVYQPSDFLHVSFAQIFSFYYDLKMPIPPALSLVEIFCIRFFGSPALVTFFGYRLGLVGAYVVAIVLSSTHSIRLIASLFLSILFLYMTTIIHPNNPQHYDLYFPMFFLLFLFLMGQAKRASAGSWKAVANAIGAGFFLSMTDLTRPFVVLVLPILLVMSWFCLPATHRGRLFCAFLVPVALFSGVWHLHQFVVHGQITATNHSGYNLRRAWPQVSFVEPFKEINNAPKGPDHWPNLNTDEHSRNNEASKKAVVKYWIENPWPSFLYALGRVKYFLSAQTYVCNFQPKPQSRFIPVYKLTVAPSAATGKIAGPAEKL